MAGIMRWLVIGGTTESVDAVKYLVSKKADVTVSVATDMGAALYVDFSVKLWVGYLDQDQFTKKNTGFRNHPCTGCLSSLCSGSDTDCSKGLQ